MRAGCCRSLKLDGNLQEITRLNSEIKEAIRLLSEGGLIAFPTETVYGLGADARSDKAVARIFEVKGRPSFNPLIVHVGSVEAALEIGDFNDAALKLVDVFWPGPLTIVVPLKKQAGISSLVTAGLPTIALRMPDHDVARAILKGSELKSSGFAIAAPSANSSGRISPTSHTHVEQDLGNKVDLIVDGGETTKGLESTIVSIKEEDGRGTVLHLLRPGTVTLAELEQASGLAVESHVGEIDEKGVGGTGNDVPLAPGSLLRHYAPRAGVRLNVLDVEEGEAVLGFGPEETIEGNFYNLSEAGDMMEAAQRLFAGLHYLDGLGVSRIAVRPIPEEGVGVAINDRLRRAAAR